MDMSMALPFEKLTELQGRQTNNKRILGPKISTQLQRTVCKDGHHQFLLLYLGTTLFPSRGEVHLPSP